MLAVEVVEAPAMSRAISMCWIWSRPTGTECALNIRMSAAISTGYMYRPMVTPAVRVHALGGVAIDRRLVGVGAVEQALAGDAGEQPGELGDLGDVGLAVEPHAVGVQPGGEPGGGDLQRRALHAQRVGRS
jgi:hypothetical protein